MTTATTNRETIRTTIDLDPQLHRELRLWCATAGPAGRSASLADVLRALTGRLLADDQLAGSIRAELAQLAGRPDRHGAAGSAAST